MSVGAQSEGTHQPLQHVYKDTWLHVRHEWHLIGPTSSFSARSWVVPSCPLSNFSRLLHALKLTRVEISMLLEYPVPHWCFMHKVPTAVLPFVRNVSCLQLKVHHWLSRSQSGRHGDGSNTFSLFSRSSSGYHESEYIISQPDMPHFKRISDTS